jgi:ArsR family transcriptional regulator, arsenate/arsenite/antimonite-responsive transcriptional repressor
MTPVSTSPDLARTARLCRALSDENRLRIVEMLTAGERCVCELTAALDLGQSLLSHHLKTLKDAGVVTDRRDGRWVYYTLNCDALDSLGAALDELTPDTALPRSEDCCR